MDFYMPTYIQLFLKSFCNFILIVINIIGVNSPDPKKTNKCFVTIFSKPVWECEEFHLVQAQNWGMQTSPLAEIMYDSSGNTVLISWGKRVGGWRDGLEGGGGGRSLCQTGSESKFLSKCQLGLTDE